ncbi:hypothetical protein LCGC14_2196180 [marine sediment metagenome]|uniref:Uncharacterized protein n=1 Tax=marine sediment metagenome TaxID=412755 RepID=A0A0F9FVJ8_9ZZZZ
MAWLTPSLQTELIQNSLSTGLWFFIFSARSIYGARCNLVGKGFFIYESEDSATIYASTQRIYRINGAIQAHHSQSIRSDMPQNHRMA